MVFEKVLRKLGLKRSDKQERCYCTKHKLRYTCGDGCPECDLDFLNIWGHIDPYLR
jgi:hypothetical protein